MINVSQPFYISLGPDLCKNDQRLEETHYRKPTLLNIYPNLTQPISSLLAPPTLLSICFKVAIKQFHKVGTSVPPSPLLKQN